MIEVSEYGVLTATRILVKLTKILDLLMIREKLMHQTSKFNKIIDMKSKFFMEFTYTVVNWKN